MKPAWLTKPWDMQNTCIVQYISHSMMPAAALPQSTDFGAAADRPWYANLRPLAVPVVVAYVAISIAYIVIRAKDSIKGISAPAYGWVVLSAEILGMVSLLQAAINHVYKVNSHLDWCCAIITARNFMNGGLC